MKGILGIGLFLCLTLPFIATWKFLSDQLYQTKKEVSVKIADGKDNEVEVLLKFTHEESSLLYWEHSKEFQFKGEMYDVIRSEIRGDTNWYWCHWDQKETKIKKSLTNLLAGTNDQNTPNKNTSDNIIRFFKSLYHIVEDKPFDSVIAFISSRINTSYCFGATSFYPFPPFHPPELS